VSTKAGTGGTGGALVEIAARFFFLDLRFSPEAHTPTFENEHAPRLDHI
jgi:hypothetical protein